MTAGTPARRPRAARVAGYAVGLALLGAAVWAALASAPDPARLFGEAGSISAGRAALLALSIVATFALISGAFGVLTARYGRIGTTEMASLICAAGLLNYLPLWPGMFGRLAYHKKYNGIALRDSAAALVWANVIGLLVAAMLLVLVLACIWLRLPAGPTLAIAGAPCALFAVLAPIVARAAPEPDPHVWRLFAAASMRYAEVLLWSLRYWLCFAMLGAPISAEASMIIACVTRFAVFVPVAPNGLGIREWAVGVAGPLLPPGIASATLTTPVALSADLFNRAAEIIVLVPLGLLGAAWIVARRGSLFRADDA